MILPEQGAEFHQFTVVSVGIAPFIGMPFAGIVRFVAFIFEVFHRVYSQEQRIAIAVGDQGSRVDVFVACLLQDVV